MKVLALNYITFVVVVMSMAGLYSCSTDYMAYDVELKDGIYFASDSLNYQFGMQKGEDFAYDMTVRVLGTPKDHDRVFGVELVADETTAKEGITSYPKVLSFRQIKLSVKFLLCCIVILIRK